jgi:hypothetical protein
VKICGFDVFASRHFIQRAPGAAPRPFFSIEQGSTIDDYEATIGPWYVVASRINNRKDALRS